MTIFGSFFDEMAAPALKEIAGEAVTVTRIDGSTLSFTANWIKREEQVADNEFDNLRLTRVRRARMSCAIADYSSPAKGEEVAIETYPGSDSTIAFRVTGLPAIVGNGQQILDLVREELQELGGNRTSAK